MYAVVPKIIGVTRRMSNIWEKTKGGLIDKLIKSEDLQVTLTRSLNAPVFIGINSQLNLASQA
uniref:Uncharacterized protein n=1 Tax=Glossina pallidipes TaxID=7398 RepID=A0A1A9Z944_GLOPL